jgi:hypothetical protein
MARAKRRPLATHVLNYQRGADGNVQLVVRGAGGNPVFWATTDTWNDRGPAATEAQLLKDLGMKDPEDTAALTRWLRRGQMIGAQDVVTTPQELDHRYHINLDERGSFYADVRNSEGKTIYEIRAGNELPDGDTSIFDDGFMRDKHDLAGLLDYLRQNRIVSELATLRRA